MIQNLTSPILVLRPLITYDKQEIIKLARGIGTFAASEQVKEQCNISTGKVTAVPHPKDFERIPDLTPIVEELLKKVIVHEGTIPLDNKTSSQLSSLPKNSFTVDIRVSSMRKKKPLSCDAEHVYPDILNSLENYSDKNKIYIFICPFGVLGKEVAHVLSKKGFKAVGLSVNEFSSLK
jgi:thiamine biosynthesis protein ThiI